MNPRVSVLISTYNPNMILLGRTLDGLAAQTMNPNNWELVLVDNASTVTLNFAKALQNFKNGRSLREERLGLLYGRLAGVRNSSGYLLIFVDDDNVLAPDYLETAVKIFDTENDLGVAGGIMEPEWCDGEPDAWASELVRGFAARNWGGTAMVGRKIDFGNNLPDFQPMGAGMVARRAALASWIAQADGSAFTDRRGADLTSGGDTEIVIEAFRSGWSVGYFPELKLTHLIPGHRLGFDYLERAYYGHNKCWVQLLYKHDVGSVTPAAPLGVMLRKAKAYVRCRAWAGPGQYIRWRAVCGHLDGRAAIYRSQKLGKQQKNQ